MEVAVHKKSEERQRHLLAQKKRTPSDINGDYEGFSWGTHTVEAGPETIGPDIWEISINSGN